MKILLLLLFTFLMIPLLSVSQEYPAFEKKWLVQGNDTLPYRILLPENYEKGKSYPLIIFLHGAGERGRDNEKQLVHGAALFLKKENRDSFPAIVIFPQCSTEDYWSNVLRIHDDKGSRSFNFIAGGPAGHYLQMVSELIPYMTSTYPVNKKKIYVAGLSMGGMGTFELVRRMPGTFAAAISICGGANPLTAIKMKDIKWWIFHGLKDDVVNPQFSKNMADALKKQGARVKLTLYPNANHNSWDSAFAEPGLLQWLFAQEKSK